MLEWRWTPNPPKSPKCSRLSQLFWAGRALIRPKAARLKRLYAMGLGGLGGLGGSNPGPSSALKSRGLGKFFEINP
jgi:hypothetical protein